MSIWFWFDGQDFNALNSGPQFEQQCRWVVDRFGITWQIVPANLQELLSGGGEGLSNPTRACKGTVTIRSPSL